MRLLFDGNWETTMNCGGFAEEEAGFSDAASGEPFVKRG